MSRKPISFLALGLFCAAAALRAEEPRAAPASEQAASILKKMAATWAEPQNTEMDMTMTMRMMGMTTESKGHARCHADGKRMAMDMTVKMGEVSAPMHSVSDGTTMWGEVEMPGGVKMVQKWPLELLLKLGQANQQNPVAGMKDLAERFDFTGVREDKLGPTDVYVLEGAVRPGFLDKQTQAAEELGGPMAAQITRAQLQNMAKARVFVNKSDFLTPKVEILDAKDETVLTMLIDNLKRGVELDDKLFAYTPPPGAQIMDMEAMFKTVREMGQKQAPAEKKEEKR